MYLNRCSYEKDVHGFFFKFISQNFFSREGAYKKVVRLFDTLGNLSLITKYVLSNNKVFFPNLKI